MVVLTSFTQPTDGIRHRQNNTTVYVNDNNLGKGTLFIAESRLSWVSDSGNGFSIEYPHISLHAVSRDLSAFPQECLFLMLDTAVGDEETSNGNGGIDDGDENDSEGETTEIRLVPDDRGMLDAMFHAMNACQALHPDPEDSFSDEDFYEDADDEIPMEETDYRMAGLRIESTDGETRRGRGLALEDQALEEEQDMEEVEGMLGRVLMEEEERLSGISGDRDRVLRPGGVGGTDNWGLGRAVVCKEVSDEQVGMLAWGNQVEMESADTAGDRVVLGEEEEGHHNRTSPPRERGEALPRQHRLELNRGMGRRGRSFSSGSIGHQGISGFPPPEHSSRTAQRNHHQNFDDAEN